MASLSEAPISVRPMILIAVSNSRESFDDIFSTFTRLNDSCLDVYQARAGEILEPNRSLTGRQRR